MSTIKVLAGDFTGEGRYRFNALFLATKAEPNGEHVPLSSVEQVEQASEESVKKLGGTLGWAAVGALALGPVGALAGALLGGKSKEVTFVARLRDGRKFMATTDQKTFTALQAATF